MRKLVLAVLTVCAAALLAAPQAGAVISASQVQTPANDTYFDPDLDAPGTLTIAGTVSGTGNVDVRCANKGGTYSFDLAGGTNVPTAAGAFSANVGTDSFEATASCRLIAVPAGSGEPYNPISFQGPTVHNAGHQFTRFSSGLNSGLLQDFYQAQASPEGLWYVYSAGDEPISRSYPVDPATGDEGDTLWGFTQIPQQTSQSEKNLRVNGRDAVLPYYAPNVPGFKPVQITDRSIDPATGGMLHVSDTEPLLLCDPNPTTCSSLLDSGIRLEQTRAGGDLGHTMEVTHRFVNTTSAPVSLDVSYSNQSIPFNPGWKFPGESGYTIHPADAIVPPLPPGPGSYFFMNTAGDACVDLDKPCGSFTWYQPPDQVRWTQTYEVLFTYHRTIPANGSIVLPFTYSQGFPQSQVDGFAAAAERGYTTTFEIGKTALNKKKGTATLAIDVPAAGSVHLEGRNLKSADVQAGAAGTVKVPVKAAGKAKKKLKKKGKAKVKPAITYTNTGLDPTSQTKKVVLKRKRKHH